MNLGAYWEIRTPVFRLSTYVERTVGLLAVLVLKLYECNTINLIALNALYYYKNKDKATHKL